MRPKNHTGPAAAAGAVVACLIGAGFASGQEVLQFFTVYGPVRGLCGAALALRPAGRAGRGNAVGRRAGRRLHPLVRPAAGQAAGDGRRRRCCSVSTPSCWRGPGRCCKAGSACLPRRAARGCALPCWSPCWPGLGRMTDILGRAGPLIAAFVAAARRGGRCCAAPPGSLCPPCPRRRPAAGGPPRWSTAGITCTCWRLFCRRWPGRAARPKARPPRRLAGLRHFRRGAGAAASWLLPCAGVPGRPRPHPSRWCAGCGPGRRRAAGAGAAGRRLHHRRAAAVWHLRGAARPPGPQPNRRAGGRPGRACRLRPCPLAGWWVRCTRPSAGLA